MADETPTAEVDPLDLTEDNASPPDVEPETAPEAPPAEEQEPEEAGPPNPADVDVVSACCLLGGLNGAEAYVAGFRVEEERYDLPLFHHEGLSFADMTRELRHNGHASSAPLIIRLRNKGVK